jgi:hypothetical protein
MHSWNPRGKPSSSSLMRCGIIFGFTNGPRGEGGGAGRADRLNTTLRSPARKRRPPPWGVRHTWHLAYTPRSPGTGVIVRQWPASSGSGPSPPHTVPASWASPSWGAASPAGAGPPDAPAPGAAAIVAPGWRAAGGPPSRQSPPQCTGAVHLQTENRPLGFGTLRRTWPSAPGRRPQVQERTADRAA